MAKFAATEDANHVEESALGFVEGDLDLPAVELHPAGDKPAVITKVTVGLSKSSERPMLSVVCKVMPEDFQFGYDVANAPDGITNTVYITKVGFGHDMGALSDAKRPNLGVQTTRRLFEACGEPWKNLRYGPREDLLGEVYLSDECLERLVGKKVQVSIQHDKDLDGNPAVKFSRIAPLA